MTSAQGKASDVLERMRRTTTKEPPATPPGGQHVATAPRGAASRPGKVRYTLDLDGIQHHFLKRFAVDAGVDASQVMRTLLTLLDEDELFAQRVMQQLSTGAMQ